MSNEYKYRVTIEETKHIPTIGKGPIRNPIMITQSQLDLFRTLGINVNICEDVKVPKFNDSEEEVIEETETEEEVLVEDEILEESEEVEEEYEESSDEVEEDSEEEVIEETETEEETDFDNIFIDDDVSIGSLTKKQLKAELTKLGVSYNNNANLNELRVLLLDNLK